MEELKNSEEFKALKNGNNSYKIYTDEADNFLFRKKIGKSKYEIHLFKTGILCRKWCAASNPIINTKQFFGKEWLTNPRAIEVLKKEFGITLNNKI